MALKTGDIIDPFLCATAEQEQVPFYTLLAGKPTALIFLRHYGCRLSRVDILDYKAGYGKIAQTGGQLILVLQSVRQILKEAQKEEAFPFVMISDPEQELYRRYEVGAAETMEGIGSPSAAEKMRRAVEELGLRPGVKEGNPCQLPATFLLGGDGLVLWAHYGTDGGDVPDVDTLVKMLNGGRQ